MGLGSQRFLAHLPVLSPLGYATWSIFTCTSLLNALNFTVFRSKIHTMLLKAGHRWSGPD